MRLVHPSVTLEDEIDGDTILRKIERAGRTCYKSEKKITNESARKFVEMIIERGHLSVLDHVSVSVRVICDRGVSHEIVRHRLCGYSQESTRYCNYAGEPIKYIIPCWLDLRPGDYDINETMVTQDSAKFVWLHTLAVTEGAYNSLIEKGWTPQKARAVLPNALKTELVWTADLQEWRHILTLRTSPKAHPQMQQVAKMIFMLFQSLIPVVFDDIHY